MNSESLNISFGLWLKQARCFHNLTLRELSKKSFVSLAHVCDLENGKRGCSLVVAKRLAEAFNMPLWKILKIIDF